MSITLPAIPQSLRDCRHEGLDSLRPEVDRALLLGAHVSSHQKLCYFETVVEIFFRLPAVEKALNEIAVL
jgi:hypothetical protein